MKKLSADQTRMNTISSELAGAVERLHIQLKRLEEEIAADKKGQQEYRTALRRLEIDKEDTQARLAKNEAYLASFDEKIGPFEKKYDELSAGIGELYDNAKVEHGKGIALLIQSFDYHPMFKVSPHGFTATPFRPK